MEDSAEPPQVILAAIINPPSIEVGMALLVMAVLLLLSALVSGSEVAFFSLSLQDLQDEQDSKTNAHLKIRNLLEQPKRLLATILIANNFVNVGIIILSTYIVEASINLEGREILAFLIQTVIVTFLILLFGEILPKVYSNKNALSIAKLMAAPLSVIEVIVKPLSSVLIASTSFIDKRIKSKTETVSVDELSHALELAANSEATEEEQKLFRGIVKFGNTDVKQVMTSRMDVIAIDFQLKYPEVLAQILEAGFSRIPVFKGSFDNVVGILYIKDLLPHLGKTNFGWQKLIRAPFFVPENKKIDDLLKEFQERKIHLAIVVDEYGGSSGIITLEDILEEIVGDIADEFDDEDIFYSKLDDNNYLFEGKILLKDLYRVLDIEGDNFENQKGDSDTLAGFILELAGKIPRVNEEIAFENYLFTIESADNRKINNVKLSILTEKQATNDEE